MSAVKHVGKVVFFALAYVLSLGLFELATWLRLSRWHMLVSCSFFVHQAVFWTGGLGFMALELSGYCKAYKIQKDRAVTKEKYLRCLLTVLLNQVFLALPLMVFVGVPMYDWAGLQVSRPTLPLWKVVAHLTVCALVEEPLFYYSHVVLHQPPLYGWIHKVHHSFPAPVAAASEYAHPVEFLVANVFPILAGPAVAQSHVTVLWAWLIIAISSTLNGHSGYELPYSPFKDASKHDWHHYSFKDNFGAIGLLDWLHGTNKSYLEHQRKLRK